LYRQFWRWSANVIDHAKLHHFIETRLGWRQWVDCTTNPRSVGNFPMQANGAEMLRLYICEATEQGYWIGGPVHDAVLLVAPLELLEAHTAKNKVLMKEASGLLLDGFKLRSEAKLFKNPDRFIPDKRGIPMWNLINNLLGTQ
jgi:DNA polymerase I